MSSLYFILFLFLLFSSVFLPKGAFFRFRLSRSEIDRKDKFQWNIRTFVLLFFFGLVSGVRGQGHGVDYVHYLEFYEYILQHGEFWSERLLGNEIGWQYLNLVIAKGGVPAPLFFGLVAVVTWCFIFMGVHRWQYLLPLMLFYVVSVGFVFFTWSGIRQALAIGITFFSFKYIIEKKPINYVFWVCIAGLFHLSALLLLPLYFARYFKYNFFIAVFLYFASLGFAGFVSIQSLFSLVAYFLGSFDVFAPYLRLVELERFLERKDYVGTGLGFFLKNVLALWIIIQSRRVIRLHSDLNIHFIFFLIFQLLTNIFFSVELVGRFSAYFFLSFSLVFASTFHCAQKGIETQVKFVFLFLFFVLYLVTMVRFLNASVGA